MNVDRSKVGRARMASINRKARGDMRTSDLVLAVVGVALLGGFCLLGLANWVGEAQGFASITGPLSPEVSGGAEAWVGFDVARMPHRRSGMTRHPSRVRPPPGTNCGAGRSAQRVGA